jgi:WXG100 family type VII secretion target
MPPSKFKADYSALSDIAKSFGSEADHSRQSINNLKSKMEQLKGGGWKGDAANKFYAEMDGSVLPAYTRLSKALDTAQQVTIKIRTLAKQTEDTTSRIFILTGGPKGGVGGNSGAPGGAAGGAGGPGGNGATAGGNGAGGGTSGGGSGGPPKWLKGKGKFFERASKDGSTSNKPSFGIKYGVAKDAVFGDAKAANGVSAIGGEIGAEFNIESLKKGKVGIFADGYVAKAQGETIFSGDKDLGFTGAGEVKVGGVSGFAGIKDGSLGASIGGSIITAKGELGANISGYNVGVNAEVGLKAELGFKIGKKTEIKLPFVTLGFSFGGARG